VTPPGHTQGGTSTRPTSHSAVDQKSTSIGKVIKGFLRKFLGLPSAGRRPVWPEIEELHRDVKALGLLILEEGEASGLPHDLHRDQRRQGAGRRAEPEERGGVPQVLERPLGGPPGLMKIFKLR